MKLIVILILMVCGVCAWAQTTQTTQPAVDESLYKHLSELDLKAANITDLSARFEQKKYTPLLKKPIISRGLIRATRAKMLWLTDGPDPTRLLITDQSLQLFYINQKILEQYPIDGKFGSLAASPLPRLRVLQDQFLITRDTGSDKLVIRLSPRNETLSANIDHILVEINEENGLIRRYEMIDPDKEKTVIEFTDYLLNPGLKENDLDLQVPPDAKVVRPLERLR